MKKLILIICLLVPAFTFAQEYDPKSDWPTKDGKIVYEKVIEITGASKNTLYGLSKKWLADAFVNAQRIIQSEDFATGQIIGKGIADDPYQSTLSTAIGKRGFKFSVQIDVKEGKSRIRIYDISVYVDLGDPRYNSDTPLNATFKDVKPITGKAKIEKAKERISTINNIFYGIIDKYETSIKSSSTDNF